jgi:hypothetical protein
VPDVQVRKIRHHLDRRLDSIERDIATATADINDVDVFDTRQVAAMLGVSHQWLEIGRSKGKKYGPPFIRYSKRKIRYRRDKLLEWIRSRKVIDPAK